MTKIAIYSGLVSQSGDDTHISDTGKKPKAIGVIFKDGNGMTHRATLSERPQSEIIVSCGAIGSPHLLLLSGIGPKTELEKFNISLVLENEFVGKGMADNPLNTIYVPTNGPIKQSLIQTVGITKLGVYIEASSGFGQSSDSIRWDHGITSAEEEFENGEFFGLHANMQVTEDIRNNVKIFVIGQLSTIPPSQRTHEAIHHYKRTKSNLPHEAFMGGFILEKVAMPLSKGQITLQNTNIADNPSITFNYFSHPSDVARCVDGIRIIEKIVRSKHFKNLTKIDKETNEKLLNMSVHANVNLLPKHTNDTKSLAQFCKDTVITIWHYHGGCHVGKVVDSDYKVLGVESLRIVDGSTFYDSPGTNPQATVMMMGRYMGVKILRERLGKAAGV
ncbi:hypothetical protein OROHE_005885 [Orobanche hederae]